jgi:hypothetical protein
MCLDYMALNENAVKNKCPLPRIDEIFDRLEGAKHFTTLDLRSKYYQVRVKDDDVPKTLHTNTARIVRIFGNAVL